MPAGAVLAYATVYATSFAEMYHLTTNKDHGSQREEKRNSPRSWSCGDRLQYPRFGRCGYEIQKLSPPLRARSMNK